MSCQVNTHLIVCLHCTILDSSTVSWLYAYGMQTTAKCIYEVSSHLIVCMYSNCRLLPFVHYRSSILVMYRKRSSEQTDAATSSTSEDFDKPPQKYLLLCHCLIIYCGSPFLIWKDIVSLHFQKLLGALYVLAKINDFSLGIRLMLHCASFFALGSPIIDLPL